MYHPKRAVLAIQVSLLLCSRLLGADYFVAPDGSDTQPGTREKPFRTIQKAADIMVAGDRCLIRKGIYRETVVPKNSGAPGSPIVYMPYNDERVVISGTEIISGWQPESGSIYRAPMGWDLGKEYNQVFVDGKMVYQARFPDMVEPDVLESSDYWSRREQTFAMDDIPDLLKPAKLRTAVRHANHRVKIVKALDQFTRPADFYAGGIYWGYHGAWRAQSAYITGSDDTSVIVADEHWADTRNTLGFTSGGVIIGLRALLDSPGEWYYDAATGMLSLWTPGGDAPAEHVIEAKKRLYAFEIRDRQHITLKGLYVFGATAAIDYCSHITIDDCHFKYITHYWHTANKAIGESIYNIEGHRGIRVVCHDFTFTNSSIQYSAGPGIFMGKDTTLADHYQENKNARIENNLIRYIDYYGSYAAGINTCMQDPALITRNTIGYAGRSAINVNCGGGYWRGHNMTITNNRLHDAMLIASDGGVFYAYGVSGQGSEFARNLLYNNHQKQGALLYLDLGGWDWIIHHNVFWIKDGTNYRNIGPTGFRNLIYNNTIIEPGWGGAKKEEKDGRLDYNNTLYCAGNPDSVGIADYKNFDFSLLPTSAAIDAGSVICSSAVRPKDGRIHQSKFFPRPFTIPPDQYAGKAPDLGAVESGMAAPHYGHDWGEPAWQYPLEGNTAARLPRLAAPHKRAQVQRLGGLLRISGPACRLELFRANGSRIRHATHDPVLKQVSTLPLANLGAGMYYLRISESAGTRIVNLAHIRR